MNSRRIRPFWDDLVAAEAAQRVVIGPVGEIRMGVRRKCPDGIDLPVL
jgi:hypothetical protein